MYAYPCLEQVFRTSSNGRVGPPLPYDNDPPCEFEHLNQSRLPDREAALRVSANISTCTRKNWTTGSEHLELNVVRRKLLLSLFPFTQPNGRLVPKKEGSAYYSEEHDYRDQVEEAPPEAGRGYGWHASKSPHPNCDLQDFPSILMPFLSRSSWLPPNESL